MAGPGDEMAAAEGRGRGELRASHAEREQVIGTLKAAFVEGMLTKDEFDLRVGQAFGSRTRGELAVVTADLDVEAVKGRLPEPARPAGEAPVLRPGPVLAVATAIMAIVWAVTLLPHWDNPENDPPRALIFLFFSGTVIYIFILAITVGNMLADRIGKRSGGQPAPDANGR